MKTIKYICVFLLVLSTILLSSCKNKHEITATKTVKKTGIEKKFDRGPIQVILNIDKKEITIADRLNLKITIIIDNNYEMLMPAFGDKLEQFGIIDYQTSSPKLLSNNKTQTTREYILEPFLSGSYKIPPMVIKFNKKGSDKEKEHAIETEEIEIVVKSLLPENIKDLKLHDIFPPASIPFQYKKILLISITSLILLIITCILFVIWKKRKLKNIISKKQIPAHIIAYQEMEHLIAENLIEKGEIKKFYQEISNILRRYIENRFSIKAPEQTTEEFLQEINISATFNSEYKQLLKIFLHHCDLVKFAEHIPSKEEIQTTFNSAKQFIEETKQADERKE